MPITRKKHDEYVQDAKDLFASKYITAEKRDELIALAKAKYEGKTPSIEVPTKKASNPKKPEKITVYVNGQKKYDFIFDNLYNKTHMVYTFQDLPEILGVSVAMVQGKEGLKIATGSKGEAMYRVTPDGLEALKKIYPNNNPTSGTILDGSDLLPKKDILKEETPATKKVIEKEPKKPIEVPKEEEKPTPKETAPIRTPKPVPEGKDSLAHCKEVLADYKRAKKIARNKKELLEEAGTNKAEIAEIEALSEEELVAYIPEKPEINVFEATKNKLTSVINFNISQKAAKVTLTTEQKTLLKERIADYANDLGSEVDDIVDNILKSVR